ncbi:MAG: PRC-barrel domain-containing protein [Firmicutes bacterium]|nr:PRC-barrel domain-containing protein [Bacillota bacterium]MCL5038857.1 PRC-barrel domain-containing protein [Bacillota bacterium]
MKKSLELIGLPIVSIAEGVELGEARELILNPVGGEVAAIVVTNGKWYSPPRVVPFSLVQGVGQDAIMVENNSAVVPLANMPELEKKLDLDISVRGVRVITRGGRQVGYVKDYYLDPAVGKIAGYELSESSGRNIIPAGAAVTIGKTLLVVTEEVEQSLTDDPSSLSGGPAGQSGTRVTGTAGPGPTVTAGMTPGFSPVSPKAAGNAANGTANNLAGSVSSAGSPMADLFKDRQEKFLLGKKSTRVIKDAAGQTIVTSGQSITQEIINRAKENGKLAELVASIETTRE